MTTATREKQQSQMEHMAEAVQEHHQRPASGAADLYPNPFPDTVMHGLWISALAGGLIGLIFGLLLDDGPLVIENWEQLYSIGSFSFVTFFTVIGIALGIAIGGVAAILIAPTHRADDEDAPSDRKHDAGHESPEGPPDEAEPDRR